MPLKYNVGESGLNQVLKPYQINAMRYLWSDLNAGRSSREVYDAVNEMMGDIRSISRASIINSLNALVDDGVLTFHEITGKGGHRRIYKATFDETGFRKFIARTLIQSLLEEFPEETKEVLKEF